MKRNLPIWNFGYIYLNSFSCTHYTIQEMESTDFLSITSFIYRFRGTNLHWLSRVCPVLPNISWVTKRLRNVWPSQCYRQCPSDKYLLFEHKWGRRITPSWCLHSNMCCTWCSRIEWHMHVQYYRWRWDQSFYSLEV